MKNKFGLLILLGALFGVIVGFVLAKNTSSIGREDVKAAQRLFNLNFNDAEIDTMLSYLEGNRKGFDSMRTFSLYNNLEPAVSFDPYPLDLNFKTSSGLVEWKVNENIKLPKNPEEIAFMAIMDLAGLIKSGQISSVELTKIYLERIKKYDPKLQAFITVTEDLALSQAQKADEEIASGNYKGPLHGIPYGIKDLAAVPDYPTTWGAAPYKDQVINETATVALKLEEAGAVLLGKLVSGSLARGDVWFGGKTKNPWDLTQGATGSSAGSGSATSAGLVGFSIGTETLGSIVSPSTRCGVTGLRPTFGAVSRSGFMTLSWSMDKVGPMCRYAADCAVVYDYIRGQDGKDRSVQNVSFELLSEADLKDLKVGYFYSQFESDTSSNHIHNQRTLEEFRKMGINLGKVELPKDYPFNVFDIILRAESGAFFDQLILSGRDSLMVEQDKGSRANSLRQSRFIPAVEYLQANRHRRMLIEEMHRLIKDYDVVISPTFGGRQMLITNLTGHPVISVPNGFDKKGRPTSITLVGNYFDEAKILALAEAYQKRYQYHGKVPKGLN
ncbi:amidase [Aquiflexum gelatinilyticum]|uniref:Amidase n=1 Tax=Aquiflexum gelatinilyticum TaxID=2961943 RepID=A0A9X2P8S4_9BACT|nr:amidase [Aquiflexum gelatinilyticum]MCR9015507.1 amidase [Aquiflexum gelatinilyticum]MCS4433078.1 amidase [Aquiflexum gelatinilyticum]